MLPAVLKLFFFLFGGAFMHSVNADPQSSLLLSLRSSDTRRNAFSALKAFALQTGSVFNIQSKAQGRSPLVRKHAALVSHYI